MTQYIDKSALVAEINQRVKDYKSHKIDDSYHDGLIFALEDLRDDFINTLEVKEVDLEKEIKNVQRKYKTIDEYKDYPCTMYANDIEWIAKHFFELGMTASNSLTAEDIKKIYHLVNEVSDDLGFRAMYINIYQETLKRYKAKKGE